MRNYLEAGGQSLLESTYGVSYGTDVLALIKTSARINYIDFFKIVISSYM